MSDIPICFKCNKPLFSVILSNKNKNTWCNCERIGVPVGWAGWVDRKPKYYNNRRDRR